MLLGGLNAVEKATHRVTEQLARLDDQAPPPPPPPAPAPRPRPITYLRPPGARPQPDFAQTCHQCGQCVAACPAQCIQLDTAQPDREPLADGLPYIIARQSPCVVCSDLSCMKACPTGALQLVAQPADIHMGVAVIDHRRCLRGPEGYQPGSPAGEDCQLCVTQCPLGGSAIGFDAAGRVQVRRGCVGCGVCERACPTEPASIFVQPFDRLP